MHERALRLGQIAPPPPAPLLFLPRHVHRDLLPIVAQEVGGGRGGRRGGELHRGGSPAELLECSVLELAERVRDSPHLLVMLCFRELRVSISFDLREEPCAVLLVHALHHLPRMDLGVMLRG